MRKLAEQFAQEIINYNMENEQNQQQQFAADNPDVPLQ